MNELEPLTPLPFPLERRPEGAHVCVIVPLYNEESLVGPLCERIAAVLATLDLTWSILFVNDGSRDGTIGALEALHTSDNRVSYLVLSRNFGHQSALSAGLDHGSGDVFITMDGDLQHPPELLPVLIDGWRQGYDVVHTSKRSTDDLGVVRSLVTRLAYRMIALVSRVPVVPHSSDFRLLDRAARDAVRTMPERGRLYRGLTPWVGFRQAVVGFDAPRRAAGASNYGVRQLVGLFGRAFFDFSAAPLYVALIAGAAAIAGCVGYLVFVLAAAAFGKSIPPGYVTQIVAITLSSAINLFLIGVLSVYVARIYDEVRRRPTYIVGRARIHSQDPT
jgi:dolichol-phosphate mannosyltransferase